MQDKSTKPMFGAEGDVPPHRFALPIVDLTQEVDRFFGYTSKHGNTETYDLPWDELQPALLTPAQRKAVQFVTYIEDHLPGYFADYGRIFPLDERVPLEQCMFNRALYHFTIRWAYEEDRHAHALATYQWRCGWCAADELGRDLARECAKPFSIGYLEPLQVFTYTLIQEKATQLYYQQLAHHVDEPVLKELMTRLARDEARHFAFFSKLLERYLQLHGEAALSPISEVVQTFRMPLSHTLENYWRLSLSAINAAGGYDHTEAFSALQLLLRRASLDDAPAARHLGQYMEQVRSL